MNRRWFSSSVAGIALLSTSLAARAEGDAGSSPVVVTAYVQSQLETHADSEDQLRASGQPINQNRFLVRRARVRADKEWEYASLTAELDANTTNGTQIDLRKAEASLLYRGDLDRSLPPYVKATLGLFDTPFGYELVESPRMRHFMERSLASRSFFPAEPDVGFRLSGGVGFFRYVVAVVNGEPLDEKNGFALRDPNNAKDIIARFGAESSREGPIAVAGGMSVLRGKGFHPGTPATKNTLVWRDINEDGTVQPIEVTGAPGTAALPSQSFSRWAVGADLRVSVRTPLGITQLNAELVIAENLDRGLFVADPIQSSQDVRELGYMVGITQEIESVGLVGFRTDLYDPNSDAFDKQAGKLLPVTQSIRTYSPIAGFLLPGRAKLLFQADFSRNHLGRDLRGVPSPLRTDSGTLRLQVEL